MTRAVLLALALTACTERQIRIASVADSALIACDVGQTYYESDGGRWDRPGEFAGSVRLETNPMLGPRPAPGLLATTGVFTILITNAIAASDMPKWARIGFIGALGVAEGYIVATHYSWDGACGVR